MRSDILKIANKALELYAKYGSEALPVVLAVNDVLEWESLEAQAGDVSNPLRENLDYGEGWFGSIEEIKKKRTKRIKNRVKKRKKKASDESVAPRDAYCGSERNKKYWAEAGDSEAVKDFLKYIDEVEC